MKLRSIAASAFWQISSQAIMAVLSVVAVKLVAIALTKELAGIYNSAYGYLQIFGILADFGLYAVAVREVSRATHRPRILGAMMVVRCGILTMSMLLAVGIAWLTPQWRGTPFPPAVLIAAFVPAFTLLSGMLRTVFQVYYKLQFVFIAETLQRVLTTGLIALIVWEGYRNSADLRLLYVFLGIGGLGAFILLILSLFYAMRLMRIQLTFDRTLILHIIKEALPYGIAYLCMALYRQMDLIYIALLRDDFALQNAYYGMPLRVADMAFIIPTYILNSVLPIISERKIEESTIRQIMSKTFLAILLSNSLFAIFSFFWAKPTTLLLTTPAYLATADHPGADQVFTLMSIPMLLSGFILYSFYVLLAHDEWRRLAGSLSIGAGVSVVCNLILVPPYGLYGTLTSAIITHLVLVAILLPQALKRQPVVLTRRHLYSLAVIWIPLMPLLWFLQPFLTTTSRTLIGGAVVGVVLLFLAWLGGLRQTLTR